MRHDTRLQTPPPMRKREESAAELLARSFGVFTETVMEEFKSVKGEIGGLRKELQTERQLREKSEFSAKLWNATVVTFATIVASLLVKLLQ